MKGTPGRGLRRAGLPDEPVELFARWYARARAIERTSPDAMALATADADGRPSARMVLLKGFDQEGFRFFTNYESRKGRELQDNPFAALVFFWHECSRQVRIEGRCERLPADESDAYFASRPAGSRIGAIASNQSRVLKDRQELERAVEALQSRFGDGPVPRPEYWGGFLLRPEVLEFWQSGPNRLHDRFRYTREKAGWKIERLAP